MIHSISALTAGDGSSGVHSLATRPSVICPDSRGPIAAASVPLPVTRRQWRRASWSDDRRSWPKRATNVIVATWGCGGSHICSQRPPGPVAWDVTARDRVVRVNGPGGDFVIILSKLVAAVALLTGPGSVCADSTRAPALLVARLLPLRVIEVGF